MKPEDILGGKVIEVNTGCWHPPFVNFIIIQKDKKQYIIHRKDVYGFPPEDQVAVEKR